MERKAISSNGIRSVGYDPDAEIMEIEYADGAVYRYLMVPQFTYRALMAAPDPSAFAESHIKNGPYANARLAE
jgi:hypothetical protein